MYKKDDRRPTTDQRLRPKGQSGEDPDFPYSTLPNSSPHKNQIKSITIENTMSL